MGYQIPGDPKLWVLVLSRPDPAQRNEVVFAIASRSIAIVSKVQENREVDWSSSGPETCLLDSSVCANNCLA
jgi:hypothetical protein